MAEVVYQVFVDRFSAHDPASAAPHEPGLVRLPWTALPEEPPQGRDIFGGDLDGIVDRIDHIIALGADAIYLTPIFRAPSNHKYDTADYFSVDDHFGGQAAFARLAQATKSRGLGLILDGVFNHVGEQHPWTRDESRRHYFRGTVWRGYRNLPELDLHNAELRDELFGEAGVVAHWIERGATGWRLDCANDLGSEICRLATGAARRAGARDGTIGEVMAYPGDSADGHYPWTGALDGVMNYWLRSCALALVSGAAPAAQIQFALDRLAADVPITKLIGNWNILSSHDTPRIATVASGDACKITQALALQFAYPGIPLIYYGEEIGMVGGADPANRAPMIWDEPRWDRDRLDFFRRLARIRRREPALRNGRYLSMAQPGTDLVAFARVTDRPRDTLLFIANGSGSSRTAQLLLPLGSLFDALPLEDLLRERPPLVMSQGSMTVELAGHDVLLLKPVPDQPSGYQFFK